MRIALLSLLGLSLLFAGCSSNSTGPTVAPMPTRAPPAAAATPMFSLAAGRFNAVQTVTISDTTAADSGTCICGFVTQRCNASLTQSLLRLQPRRRAPTLVWSAQTPTATQQPGTTAEHRQVRHRDLTVGVFSSTQRKSFHASLEVSPDPLHAVDN